MDGKVVISWCISIQPVFWITSRRPSSQPHPMRVPYAQSSTFWLALISQFSGHLAERIHLLRHERDELSNTQAALLQHDGQPSIDLERSPLPPPTSTFHVSIVSMRNANTDLGFGQAAADALWIVLTGPPTVVAGIIGRALNVVHTIYRTGLVTGRWKRVTTRTIQQEIRLSAVVPSIVYAALLLNSRRGS